MLMQMSVAGMIFEGDEQSFFYYYLKKWTGHRFRY